MPFQAASIPCLASRILCCLSNLLLLCSINPNSTLPHRYTNQTKRHPPRPNDEAILKKEQTVSEGRALGALLMTPLIKGPITATRVYRTEDRWR